MKLSQFTIHTTPISLCSLSVLCASVVALYGRLVTRETPRSQGGFSRRPGGRSTKLHEITLTTFRARSCDFVDRGLSQNLAHKTRNQTFELQRAKGSPTGFGRARTATQILLIAALLVIPTSLYSATSPQSAPNIGVSGSLSPNKVRRGRTVQGTIVMNIPSGYHANSNKPLEKFLIPTQLKIEAPSGLRVGPIVYPRAQVRSLKFSKNKVAVFERQTTIRFTVTVPAGFKPNSVELKARLRYQSCSDDVCFPPQNKDVSLWLTIEG